MLLFILFVNYKFLKKEKNLKVLSFALPYHPGFPTPIETGPDIEKMP